MAKYLQLDSGTLVEITGDGTYIVSDNSKSIDVAVTFSELPSSNKSDIITVFIERGFIYKIGSGQIPLISDYDNIFTENMGLGFFSYNFNGLTDGMTYSVRAYAKDSINIEYGNIIEVTLDVFVSTIRRKVIII